MPTNTSPKPGLTARIYGNRKKWSRLIIGVDYYNYGFDQQFYDTPIPTSELDEVMMGAGMYDEVFISVDDTIDEKQEKPAQWTLKTIMDANFNNNLEAGSINGSGHKVTKLQCYRREYLSTDTSWQLVANFDYDSHYNLYTVIDRFIENEKTYEYSIVPLANDIMGDILIGPPVKSEFSGVFISDIDTNFAMNVDLSYSDLTYNTSMSQAVPLNGQFPIVSFGNANYRTGSISFLPLTPQQEFGYESKIDAHAELLNRNNVINFLNNGKAKVIRRDDGDILVVATSNVKTAPKAEGLESISNVTFDFVEIGKLDYNTMEKGGLISSAGKSVYTYDDDGNIVWNQEGVAEDGSKAGIERYRNSFTPVPIKRGVS